MPGRSLRVGLWVTLSVRPARRAVDLSVVAHDARPAEPTRTCLSPTGQVGTESVIYEDPPDRVLHGFGIVRGHRHHPFAAVGEYRLIRDDDGTLEGEQETQRRARRLPGVAVGEDYRVDTRSIARLVSSGR